MIGWNTSFLLGWPIFRAMLVSGSVFQPAMSVYQRVVKEITWWCQSKWPYCDQIYLERSQKKGQKDQYCFWDLCCGRVCGRVCALKNGLSGLSPFRGKFD